jgi:hypothetical protein
MLLLATSTSTTPPVGSRSSSLLDIFVLVLFAFLLYSIDYDIDAFVLGANLVAISTYCVWKLSFILPTLSNMVA